MQNLPKKLTEVLSSRSSKKLDALQVDDFVIFGNKSGFAEDVIISLKDYLKKGEDSILFISDQEIWQKCQNFFPQDLKNLVGEILLLKNPKADEENLERIHKSINNHNFILGLGSGTINDLCKYSSAKNKVPYAIFPSAPSMNGYLSKNASITVSGHKKTLSATLPSAVFCDLNILKSAPLKLVKAGIGDSLCFYSCWFDWYLSHKILGTKFDQRPFDLLEKKMDFLLKNFDQFSIKDEQFLQLLLEILLLSGLGMTIADGSHPASESEHLIAHTIDMKFSEISQDLLHGQMIAVTSVTVAKMQKHLLHANLSSLMRIIENLTNKFSDIDAFKNGNIVDFFGKEIAAECVTEYQQKLALIKESSKKLSEKSWESLKKELQEIHCDESKLKEIFAHFKVKTSAKSLGLSKEQYQSCINHAKFIRNRFTCLDLI